MATVSGGNSTNKVKVSNTKAEYYSDLTKGYMEKTQEYMEVCQINSERSNEQYQEITAILEDLPTTKQSILDEITNLSNDKIEDIAEATEEYKTAALEEMNAAKVENAQYTNTSKDWATKMDGMVDGEDYSSKYYALQAKNEREQALSDISSSVETAQADITLSKESAVNEITTTRTTVLSDITTDKAQAQTDIQTDKETALKDILSSKTNAEQSLMNQFNTYSSTLDDEMDAFIKNYDRMYEGINLETKFAEEITAAGDVYKWLENRKNAGNFEGIHVGDYFYTSISAGTVAGYTIAAQTFKCRIAGINTYKSCADTNIGNMFYIISDEVIDTPIKWNPTDNNNGTSIQNKPWLASAAYAVLNGANNYTTSAYNNVAHGANASSKGILQLLPTALQSVLKQKRNLIDNRYSASGLLTGSTSWDWGDMGKLWLPNEYEVYGCAVRSNLCQTAGFWHPEAGLSIQFPWFANNCEHRVKRNSAGGRCSWWLSSVASNNTTNVCYVSYYGIAGSYYASYSSIYLPLCFCI